MTTKAEASKNIKQQLSFVADYYHEQAGSEQVVNVDHGQVTRAGMAFSLVVLFIVLCKVFAIFYVCESWIMAIQIQAAREP